MSLISVILTNDSLENGSTVFHVGDVVSLRSSLTMDKYRPLTINKFITVNEKLKQNAYGLIKIYTYADLYFLLPHCM